MNTETLQIVSFVAFLGRRKLIPPNKPISLLVPFVSHRTEHRLGIILSNLCKSAPVAVAVNSRQSSLLFRHTFGHFFPPRDLTRLRDSPRWWLSYTRHEICQNTLYVTNSLFLL
jgi:hypothetical protein